MSAKTSTATDLDFKAISELSYLNLDNEKFKQGSLYEIFYNGDKIKDDILTQAQTDKALADFVHKLQTFPENYKDSLKKYTLVDTSGETSTGYYGIAVQNSSGEVIVGSRGTEVSSVKDIYADLKMASGKLTGQFDSAQEFVNNLQRDYTFDSLSFTGHSLGGSISTYLMVNNYDSGLVAKRLLNILQSDFFRFYSSCLFIFYGRSYRIQNLSEYKACF